MYAICVEYYGNYGAIVPSGNVYVVANFTQKMCEMSPRQLADYVQNNNITVL